MVCIPAIQSASVRLSYPSVSHSRTRVDAGPSFGHMQVCRPSLRTTVLISLPYVARLSFTISFTSSYKVIDKKLGNQSQVSVETDQYTVHEAIPPPS